MGGSKRLNFRQGGHVFGASQPLAVYWTRFAERWKDDEHNLQDIAPVGKAQIRHNQDLGVERDLSSHTDVIIFMETEDCKLRYVTLLQC